MAIINSLNDLADKVRARTGLENEMTIEQMGDAVTAIPYPIVEQLTITQNGTYYAPSGIDGFDTIVANVQSSLPRAEEVEF